MKNKLRRKLTALALCGVMIFSGSSSALADSQAGEIDENQIVQEQVLDEVVEEADTEVQEPAVEEATQELVPETVEPVIEEAPVEEVVEEVVEEPQEEIPTEEVVEEQPQVEIQEVEAQPTVVEQVVEAVATATEKVVEVVETVIRYIIGIHDDLTYEDDQVIIKVYAEQDEIIPEGTKIKVVPILADDEATKAQYEEVAAGLQEKAAADEQIIEGFLAYDITLVDPEGNEFEPNGEVKVTMDYKKAALPADVENVEEAEVTIHHFEEDANGEVKQIVDMVAEAAIEAVVEVTEAAEVEKVEFVTTSFSTYTITWASDYGNSFDRTLTATVVDASGNTISGMANASVEVESGEEYIFSTECENLTASGKTYVFQKAVVASSTSNISSGVEIYSMSGSFRNGYKYKTSASASEITFNSNSNNLYLVYAEQGTSSGGSTGSGSGSSTGTAELAHQKYIKDNNDGTYDLTLNLIGAAGTETDPAEVDVIFVMDTSGSMERGMSSNSNVSSPNRRLDYMNTAVRNAINTIEAKTDVDANYALVTFESSATTKRTWTKTASNITNNLPTSVDGGTNYEDALLEVKSLLASSSVVNDGAAKIVVFITDGDCTQYNSGYGVAGNGNSYDSTAMTKAQAVLEQLTSMSGFYTVGVGPSASYTHLSTLNTAVPAGVATKSYNGTDSTNLGNAFSEIVGSVTTISASNVTIVDTLTAEVDLQEGTELVVKVTDENGNDVTAAEVAAGEITATYNAEQKQIRLDFKDSYEVKNNYTYSVTAKITTNTDADNLYIDNNYSYPHTGEENTDAPNNATSSGKKGIFSNVDGSALLTYTTGGTNKVAEYNRPVVQIKDVPVKPPTTEKELSREKYIKYNSADDSYDLTLNVAGQVGSLSNQAKLDVILILDRSGSMKGDNLDDAQAAVTTLMDSLINKGSTIDARCKVITFSSSASDRTDWVSLAEAKNSVNSLTDTNMSGGTDYQAGFVSAEAALGSTRADAQKIVIFLTDGQPTESQSDNNGSYTTVTIINETNEEAKNIACDQFYAVGLGLGNVTVYNGYSSSSNTTGLAILQNITNNVAATTKSAYNSNASTDLSTIFATIAGSITKFYCSDVTIKDNLSEYVEVNGEAAKLEIKVTQVSTTETVVGTATGNVTTGATLELAATNTNSAATLTASYNPELKQVVLDFPDNYQLEADYKYYVTVNIIASEKAYEEYAKNNGQYDNVGEAGTDAEGNATSVEKPGFRSNSSASVSYTYNGTESSADYAHPVVQVFVKQQEVEKVWVGTPLTSVNAILNASVTIDGRTKDLVPSAVQELTAEDSWKYTWNYLPKFYHENGKYSEITYTVTEEMLGDIADKYTVSYENTTGKTVITNKELVSFEVTKVWNDFNDKFQIRPTSIDVVLVKDNVETETKLTLNADNEWKAGFTGLLKYDETGKEIQYSVKEIEVPGYTVSYDGFTITNTLNEQSLKLVKQSKTDGSVLSGAKFKLQQVITENGTTVLKDVKEVTTASDGIIFDDMLLYGTYKLTEIEAPAGYSILEEAIYFEVSADGIKYWSEGDSATSLVANENVFEFVVYNTVLYELPSTGGLGIYVPMMSGVIMMMAAAFILMNNKRKEVL